MKFVNWVRNLERKNIVTKRIHPIIPFVLTIIIILLGAITLGFEINSIWANALFYLAGFSFIFAILHWIVVRALKK